MGAIFIYPFNMYPLLPLNKTCLLRRQNNGEALKTVEVLKNKQILGDAQLGGDTWEVGWPPCSFSIPAREEYDQQRLRTRQIGYLTWSWVQKPHLAKIRSQKQYLPFWTHEEKQFTYIFLSLREASIPWLLAFFSAIKVLQVEWICCSTIRTAVSALPFRYTLVICLTLRAQDILLFQDQLLAISIPPKKYYSQLLCNITETQVLGVE